MKRKELIAKLEENKGKDFVVEIEGKTIQKTTIKKMNYEIKEDKLYMRSSIELDFVEINLNTVREINFNPENIAVLLEDKEETKIKISAI